MVTIDGPPPTTSATNGVNRSTAVTPSPRINYSPPTPAAPTVVEKPVTASSKQKATISISKTTNSLMGGKPVTLSLDEDCLKTPTLNHESAMRTPSMLGSPTKGPLSAISHGDELNTPRLSLSACTPSTQSQAFFGSDEPLFSGEELRCSLGLLLECQRVLVGKDRKQGCQASACVCSMGSAFFWSASNEGNSDGVLQRFASSFFLAPFSLSYER